ncbi:hypothetical protein J6590_033497 [Homalodisca vitripennis]|nr:hypothetical protein J6590_033497 [Homalodisca vitripennis]
MTRQVWQSRVNKQEECVIDDTNGRVPGDNTLCRTRNTIPAATRSCPRVCPCPRPLPVSLSLEKYLKHCDNRAGAFCGTSESRQLLTLISYRPLLANLPAPGRDTHIPPRSPELILRMSVVGAESPRLLNYSELHQVNLVRETAPSFQSRILHQNVQTLSGKMSQEVTNLNFIYRRPEIDDKNTAAVNRKFRCNMCGTTTGYGTRRLNQ